MPASQSTRAKLLRELNRALQNEDAAKVELRRARKQVGEVMRRLDIHTHRQRRPRKGNSA